MPPDVFADSRGRFESLVAMLSGAEAAASTHGDLEERLHTDGMVLLRGLLQDHLSLRAVQEQRVDAITGSDGVVRTRAERGRTRALATVFGEVEVERIVYRAPGAPGLNPADMALSLPREKHSHGLRRRAAVEAVRGSFDDARAAIARSCGSAPGKRQVEELVQRAAMDVDDFYRHQRPEPAEADTLLVLTFDAKGIVMLPAHLREATRRNAARKDAAGGQRLASRLSSGEKRGRKRMAEVAALDDAHPVARTPLDIIPATALDREDKVKGPVATGKWVTASVRDSCKDVVATVFDEAERRDPDHARTWVVLVDGAQHQLEVIRAEAEHRKVTVHIVCDIVHVIEYVWKAAWSFFPPGDLAAEAWVGEQTRRILAGKPIKVAAAIRQKATMAGLAPAKRAGADKCADYLHAKAPYLDYGKALTAGWPIATGIVEGACRYLVKDRMDITGARWSLTGAEAVLKLRAVHASGDFDAYWQYHLQREHLRVHTIRYRDQLALAA
ncbi:ISKra4 family transposase [Streptomyces achmelvichensis]|uniref:ISKra4 family transposase n=1 Tax=Streptomyces achmelvichensis TaxID=3134111 RepID=UPI003C12C52C